MKKTRRPGGASVSWFLVGVGIGALYLAILWSAWPSPPPPGLLFDGYVPSPAYRWVRPPYASLQQTEPPQPGERLFPLTSSGSVPGFVETGDAQAGVIVPEGAFIREDGEPSVEVRITPLDPDAITTAPRGMRYDTNAYRIDATYTVSHRPAVLHAPVNVVLRYATGSTALLHLSGLTWAMLPSQPVVLASQVYAPTPALGVFVAVVPHQGSAPIWAWLYRVLTVALWGMAAVTLAWILRDYLQRTRRRSWRP